MFGKSTILLYSELFFVIRGVYSFS